MPECVPLVVNQDPITGLQAANWWQSQGADGHPLSAASQPLSHQSA